MDDVQVPIPADEDGFVRRECPNCKRQFKWHDGPANEEAGSEPAPPSYYCPLCGGPALVDEWFTEEQIDHVGATAMPTLVREFQREMKDAFRSSSRRSGIRFQVDNGDVLDVPAALIEPNDMQIVASPCHPYEPVKVPDGMAGPFHCLICGEKFAV
jgi:hypothetical protein